MSNHDFLYVLYGDDYVAAMSAEIDRLEAELATANGKLATIGRNSLAGRACRIKTWADRKTGGYLAGPNNIPAPDAPAAVRVRYVKTALIRFAVVLTGFASLWLMRLAA